MDVHIALELLHCTYSEYITRTSQRERLMNQFFLMLKNLKDEHAQDEAERQRELEREADDMLRGRT
jgi:hypothetical protein